MTHAISPIELYDNLRRAPDEDARARIISEAFQALEQKYPDLANVATRQDLSETELRLIKEIEQVRAVSSKEIEQVRADLSKEIEQVRADLSKDIAQVRADLSKEIEHVRLEIREVELTLTKEIHSQSRQTLTYITLIMGVMLGGLKLLDFLLA